MITKSAFIGQYVTDITKHYEFLEELGSGTYGKVYKVKHKTTKSIYACKKLNKRTIKNKERFKLEINLLKETDHPNIIRLHELYEDSVYLYFITELCKGGELFDRLAKRVNAGKLYSEKETSEIILQIISALNYCHSHGICHRDIKPENILFVNENSNEIKLIDFGLSKIFTKDHPMHSMVGTTYYMSPEVLTGEYDEKCDIWSSGCILYIMMCGRPPFYAKNDMDLMRLIKSKSYSFNYNEFKKVSYEVKELISFMLCDSNKRSNAQEVINHKWFINNKTTKENNNNNNSNKMNIDDEVILNNNNTRVQNNNRGRHIRNKSMMQDDYINNSLNKETSLEISLANMTEFSHMNKVKKGVFEFIATKMTEDEISDLKESFQEIDKNKDGVITVKELQASVNNVKDGSNNNLIHKMSENLGFKDIKQFFNEIDLDHNGLINYSEFLASAMDHRYELKKDLIYEAFKTFDVDQNNKISPKELKRIIQPQTKEDIKYLDDLINKYDKDKDGQIDVEEFMTMLDFIEM